MSNRQTGRPDSTRGAVARARCARENSGAGRRTKTKDDTKERMNSLIAFEEDVIDAAQEMVGTDVVIDFVEMELSLVEEHSGERIGVPISALTHVELEEEPEIRDHGQ